MIYIPNLKKIENNKIDDVQLCIILEKIMHQMNINNYDVIKIDTDASKRHYYRIITNKKTYILMDSRLEPESFSNYIKIDDLLLRNSLRAPIILAKNLEQSVMVIEDFGDMSFNNYLKLHPHHEENLYDLAIKKLELLHTIDIDIEIPDQNEEFLNEGLHTFIEWYIIKNFNQIDSEYISRGLIAIFNILYPFLYKTNRVIVLRDFHADNLIHISQDGEFDLGILDFQDAVVGSPIYDFMSLLEDIRRDLDNGMIKRLKQKFFMRFDQSMDDLERIYSILAVQRSLRIIGTFHRLNICDNKPKYLSYLPKVWSNLRSNLEHPAFESLKLIFKHYNI